MANLIGELTRTCIT